jgi:hypothetical protein
VGLLAILLFMLTLGLLMLGASWAMNVAADRTVGDQHRLLQSITETGEVPESWRRPYEARIARLRMGPDRATQSAEVEKQAWRDYLQKLDRLVRYAQTTTLVDSEETRQLLLGKLASAGAQWQAAGSAVQDGRGGHGDRD